MDEYPSSTTSLLANGNPSEKQSPCSFEMVVDVGEVGEIVDVSSVVDVWMGMFNDVLTKKHSQSKVSSKREIAKFDLKFL